MNYRNLLKRYMQHVLSCESIDYTDRLNDEMDSEVKFPEEEVAELRKISGELQALESFGSSFPDESMTVHDLGLSARIANRLENEGARLLVELLKHNEIDLLKMPDIGRTALNEIKKAVLPFGGLSETSIRHNKMMREREELGAEVMRRTLSPLAGTITITDIETGEVTAHGRVYGLKKVSD